MTNQTERKLARITGLRIEWISEPGYMLGFDGIWMVVQTGGKTPEEAGKKFLRYNLMRAGRVLLSQQHCRCAHCDGYKPLQLDHITPRSKSRDDRLENLRMLCLECHNRRHNLVQ